MNKLTLKDRRVSYYFILCLNVADPATFLASNSVLVIFFPPREQLSYSAMDKINISEFVSLPH